MQDAFNGPRFELTTFLDGHACAWGMVEDRFGRVRRSFSVEMRGGWHDGVFMLDETFTFDDGEIDHRVWRVVPGRHGRFTATSKDCVGVAQGVCTADLIRMSYKFRLRVNSRELVVDFDDRIHRMKDGLAMNRATMRKWGVKVGELFIVFSRKAGQQRDTAAAA